MEVQDRQNPFLTALNGNEPKQQQIENAVEMLLQARGRDHNQPMAKLWGRLLRNYSSEELAFGFEQACFGIGQPSLADIRRPIDDREFLADYSWLLSNLKIHGAKWRDRGAVLGEPRRSDSNEPDKLYVRDELEPAVKAPEIPDRLQEALYALGNGDQARGRELLSRHPFASGGEIDLREKRQLDESFRAAWDGVRVREIAGVVVASSVKRVR